jgi:exopolysaccharide biosynthesis polyprenyl glycosylphosphotransferase
MIHYKTGFQNICQQIMNYDAVLINDVPAQNRNDILKYCYEHHIRAYVVPKISDIIVRGAKSVNLFDTPLMVVEGSGLNLSQRVWKRAMDIVLGSIAIVVASPIMLVVAIAIKLDDHGPVFYKQTRVTLNGKKFDILKFRSMIVNAEKDGHSIPAKDGDPRITRVGRVIRATRIDELPQILNILKGDMSIVGPRPERVEHMELYCKEIPEFRNRLKVKGGLTGYAQIFGKYNTTAYDKLRLDMMYIEDYSLLLDLKLIVLTLRVMLQKESTEGFDKVEENKKRLDELLCEMREEDDSYQEELTTDRR